MHGTLLLSVKCLIISSVGKNKIIISLVWRLIFAEGSQVDSRDRYSSGESEGEGDVSGGRVRKCEREGDVPEGFARDAAARRRGAVAAIDAPLSPLRRHLLHQNTADCLQFPPSAATKQLQILACKAFTRRSYRDNIQSDDTGP